MENLIQTAAYFAESFTHFKEKERVRNVPRKKKPQRGLTEKEHTESFEIEQQNLTTPTSIHNAIKCYGDMLLSRLVVKSLHSNEATAKTVP